MKDEVGFVVGGFDELPPLVSGSSFWPVMLYGAG
jgi:hypothetical protein